MQRAATAARDDLRTPARIDGYAPIVDYAAVGDGRSLALVALDGSVDWLCLPSFADGAVFGALLDPNAGGRFALAPEGPFGATRRYVPDTNVLETTFVTDTGAVRVTDAMNLQHGALLAWSELVRRVECVAGEVTLRWSVEPRFDFGRQPPQIETHDGVPVAAGHDTTVVVRAFGAGHVEAGDGAIGSRCSVSEGDSAVVAVAGFPPGPVLFPTREELERRLEDTIGAWRAFTARGGYDGPWRDEVMRSALALKLLVHSPNGAVVAAPTTSLPEALGGERNYDYRFAWTRDASFTLDAFLALGYREQCHASLCWLLDAARHTHPRVVPLYKVSGEPPEELSELPLAGYRGSRPVLLGNGAADQPQFGNYADILSLAQRYTRTGGRLDEDTGLRLAQIADFLCEVWRNPDHGIWELPQRHHYVHSKMAAWQALHAAAELAAVGQLPVDRRSRWTATADEARRWVDRHGWSARREAFLQRRGDSALDAAVLLAPGMGFLSGDDPRLSSTIDAVVQELAVDGGPLLYRYSGMASEEGAFLACSFWLVEALVSAGRHDEAAEQMEAALSAANDVGLLSEEIDPASGEQRGNFPQALSHLSAVNAATALARSPVAR